MAVVEELIRTEADGGISFGNYELDTKTKVSGLFVYESVPGTTVTDLKVLHGGGMIFDVEGNQDAQITLEMEEDTEYKVVIDNVSVGSIKTNLGGKLSFSVELEKADKVAVKIEKM